MGNKTKFTRGSISYARLYESLSESDKKLIDVRFFKELCVNRIHKIKAKADYTDSINNSILRWIDLYDNFITYIKGVFDKFDDGKLFHFEVSYSADGKAEDINISYRFKYSSESTKLIYARSLNIERTVIFNFDPFYFIDGFMHIMLPNNDTSVIYLDGNIHEILVYDISYILSEVEFIAFMQEALRAYVTSINCIGKINLVGIPDSLIEKCGKINAFYKENHEAYEKALSANIKENGRVKKKKNVIEEDLKKIHDYYCARTKMKFTLDKNGNVSVIFNPSLGENKKEDVSSTIPKCEYIMEGHKITHRPHIFYYKERFLSISQDPQFKLTWGNWAKITDDDYKRELIRAVVQCRYLLDDLVITDDFVAFNTVPSLHIYMSSHFDGLAQWLNYMQTKIILVMKQMSTTSTILMQRKSSMICS